MTSKSVQNFDDVEPGTLVRGEGIYIGRMDLLDEKGHGLVGTFNIFASPRDLSNSRVSRELSGTSSTRHSGTTTHLAQRMLSLFGSGSKTQGHGYFNYGQGEHYPQKAIRDGRYNGQWFVPSRQVLQAIYDLREQGALKGTFAQTTYWAADKIEINGHHWQIDFSNGEAHLENNFGRYGSTRLVRAVPVMAKP